jgi:hypothetical protein
MGDHFLGAENKAKKRMNQKIHPLEKPITNSAIVSLIATLLIVLKYNQIVDYSCFWC